MFWKSKTLIEIEDLYMKLAKVTAKQEELEANFEKVHQKLLTLRGTVHKSLYSYDDEIDEAEEIEEENEDNDKKEKAKYKDNLDKLRIGL